MSLPRVGYWTANYMPEYEAISKEIAALMEGLAGSIDASLVSLDTRDRRLALRGRVKRLPIPFGLPLFPLLAPQVAGADVNHVFASAADRRLTPVMARYNGVLSIARGTGDGPGIERNGPVLRRLRAVVAQCEPDRDLMLRLGVS